MRRRLGLLATLAVIAPLGLVAGGGHAAAAAAPGGVKHLVVIYEENHSFDNLYGLWGPVDRQRVNGLDQATSAAATQVGQDGKPLNCLYQDDVNLTSPSPLATTCTDSGHPAKQGSPPTAQPVNSHFGNAPFRIDDYVSPSDATCPKPGDFSAPNGYRKGDPKADPGGCTRDLVHRFYQEQYQIDGGRQDRYTTGSDAAGLTQGYYDTRALPIWKYLHGAGAPHYVVEDNTFQAGFGGSFLNHQMLVAAQAPVYPNADTSGTTSGCATGTANCDLHSVVDGNAFPNAGYPYYTPTGAVKDQALTEAADSNGRCAASYGTGAVTAPSGTLCGDWAVNTIQPQTQPYAPGALVGKRLPLLTSPNIGDRLSQKNVSWAWYAGGWDNAAGNNGRDVLHPLGRGWTNGTGSTCADPGADPKATFPNCPDRDFQFHHQPFPYYANYADGTPGRVAHLKDEKQFIQDAAEGDLPAVSFVKPIGEENEHPGYASETQGSSHLVSLLKTIENGPDAASTMVVVTYDEFGGSWDHVPPPGTPGNPGPHDAFGPGTRIPMLVIDPSLPRSGVDHTQHDTTSVLATIEHLFGVRPLTLTTATGPQTRDARVRDLLTAFDVRPAPNCQAGDGRYTVTADPARQSVRRGSPALLRSVLAQAGRRCQAGLPVTLYVRYQGSRGFARAATVRTDGAGQVRLRLARAGRSFQWYATASGARSRVASVLVRPAPPRRHHGHRVRHGRHG